MVIWNVFRHRAAEVLRVRSGSEYTNCSRTPLTAMGSDFAERSF